MIDIDVPQSGLVIELILILIFFLLNVVYYFARTRLFLRSKPVPIDLAPASTTTSSNNTSSKSLNSLDSQASAYSHVSLGSSSASTTHTTHSPPVSTASSAHSAATPNEEDAEPKIKQTSEPSTRSQYLNPLYPLWEPAPDLPTHTTDFQKWQAIWNSSPYPAQLTSLITRIISDRASKPISNAICLGIGYGLQREMLQLIAFTQIVTQLTIANPSLASNIYIQDPGMVPGMRALWLSHGYTILENPEAFAKIGPETFLFSAWVECVYLVPNLVGKPVSDLALFVGNGWSLNSQMKGVTQHTGNGMTPADVPIYKPIVDSMLDPLFCNRSDFPCERPNGKFPKEYNEKGPMNGLADLDVWWRPVRTEDQKSQVLALKAFYTACTVGFLGDFVEFGRVYRDGFQELDEEEQIGVMCGFCVWRFERYKREGGWGDRVEGLEGYWERYQKGERGKQDMYKEMISGYVKLFRDDRAEKRTFCKFFEGDFKLEAKVWPVSMDWGDKDWSRRGWEDLFLRRNRRGQ